MLVLFFCASLGFTACEQSKEPSQQAETSGEERLPDQEGWNSTVRATRHGKLQAIVHYGHMMRYQGEHKIHFDQGIHVEFFQESGEKASELSAQKGFMDERSHVVKAMNHVIVESDTGITLYTEELYYEQQSQKIVSHVDVKITTAEGDTLYGNGLVSDPNLVHFNILKPHGRAHKGFDMQAEENAEPAATGNGGGE